MKRLILLALAFALGLGAATTAPPTDALGRTDPRSTVTAFLKTCHASDYAKAGQYLDLSRIPSRVRAQQGIQLAKELESLLNSASSFDAMALSQDPQGRLEDDNDPDIEHVTQVSGNGEKYTLELQRMQPPKAPPYWVFSAATVAELPKLTPVPTAESAIEARLPRFLVSVQILETALWKWIALLFGGALLFALFRLLTGLVSSGVRRTKAGYAWTQSIVDPLLVLVIVIAYRIFEEFIAPAALTRLYIGRALLMFVVASFAWGVINLLDFLLTRVDTRLSTRQRIVSHSVIYLGRRVVKVVVAVFAAILILDNWGFNMTTIIAGLGVGGIAIALAAQQTIANVFGVVSVIGDSPIMIGDFGNFGGVTGTVEEIGMRSARVRTLNRTVVSIPNSSFASINLENFAVRDKILFNPTIQIKRTTPKDQIRKLMQGLEDMLAHNKQVEVGPTPVRISTYSAASFGVELFAYVLTADVNEFYKHQAELFLSIDDVVTSAGVELA